MSDMLTVMDHPLIRHKITLLRDINTKPAVFRMLVREIAQLMLCEATRDLAIDSRAIETPLTATTEPVLAKPYPVLVSIMRAGNAMLDGALDI
ncbi:MAG: uracil phosphoribosyltransferase, partial [Alphaproteobacteria bacterium]